MSDSSDNKQGSRRGKRGRARAEAATPTARSRPGGVRGQVIGEASAANPEWLEKQLAQRRRERQRQRRTPDTSQPVPPKPGAKKAGAPKPGAKKAGSRKADVGKAGAPQKRQSTGNFHADVRARTGARRSEAAAAARSGSAVRPGRPARSARVTRPVRQPSRAELRARERRQLLFKRRMRAVLAVTAAGAVIVGLYAVPRLGIFSVRNVQITGASAVPDLAVRARIDPLLANKTVFTVDLGKLKTNIEQLPFVRSVSVNRQLPDGLEIVVTEYQPLALGLAQNGSWLVARDGRVLVKARLSDWADRVPVVRLQHGNVSAGDSVGDEPALQLLRVVPATFPGTFRTVELTPAGIIGAIADGPIVRIGRADQFVEKLLVTSRLLSLYGPARRANISYIDVTVPARPAISMTNG